tara:strand:+ start:1227 stop:2132 length:906 start_codon:yes stop_codon:yes gene_type:complete
MKNLIILFHYSKYQEAWEQANLIQAGPSIDNNKNGIEIKEASISLLQKELLLKFPHNKYTLIYYTDPFFISSKPLRGLNKWKLPKIIACGDLHHGFNLLNPINTLKNYLEEESFNSAILTFNPILIKKVRENIKIPVNSFPPSFFKYPKEKRTLSPIFKLIHIGSIGKYHQERKQVIDELIIRKNIPIISLETENPEIAATIYSKHALALNIPLNNDLNHRFFEIIAAGIPQIVLGKKEILGDSQELLNRKDIFWASTVNEIEKVTKELFANPEALKSIEVLPPNYLSITELLKKIFYSFN